MPLSIDVVLNNKVLGPAFRRHLEEGHEKGRMEGELAILRRLLQARFGPIPASSEQRLITASEAGLNAIADRALPAASLEDLFPSPDSISQCLSPRANASAHRRPSHPAANAA